MSEALSTLESELPAEDLRSRIVAFEDLLRQVPGAVIGDTPTCPLKHSFANGIYMREIHIPAGMVIVGKIHRHAHPNVLLKGEVLVVTEQRGIERLVGPVALISEAGTKRALYALTDLHWATFHNVGDERDLNKIEAMVIAPDFAELAAPKEEVCLS